MEQPTRNTVRIQKYIQLLILGGFTAAGIAVAMMSAMYMRGSHEQLLQMFIASALSTFPMVVALICYAAAVYTGQQAPLTAGSIFAGITFALLLQIPGYMLGQTLLSKDIAAAKAYCESLVVALDQHYNDYGHYPQSMDNLLPESERPRLLTKDFCRLEDTKFSFEIYDPAELMGFYDYSSEKREWTHWAFFD
ncbi:MAG: hypothetical protein R3C45_07860 [Phycisphaerales bacterium]